MNLRFKKLILATCLVTISMPAHALDILGRDSSQGGQGVKRGLVALYRFNPTRNGVTLPANTIADESGVGTPLDLQISSTLSIQRKCDRSFLDPVTNTRQNVCYLDFTDGSKNVARSIAPATKIASMCKTSNSLTVEMWVRNDRSDELTKEGRMMPLKIVSMGRGTSTVVNNKYIGASNDFNFSMGLDYDMAAQYFSSVRRGPRTQRDATAADGFTNPNATTNAQQIARYAIETSQTQLNTPDSPTTKILYNDKLQQIIFTYKSDGTSSLYASTVSEGEGAFENPFALLPVPRMRATDANITNPFSGWGDQFFLSLGNEATYADTSAPTVKTGGNITYRTENREWRGEIYTLAIYCDAHTDVDILGDAAPGANFKSYPPNPAVQLTPNHLIAAQIYNRIVGVKIPVTAPIISGVNDPRIPGEDYQGRGMVQLLAAGNAFGAAQLAANEDGFYNITVRDFAKRMSIRDESVNTPLNDFVATIIGVTRDNIPATQLLTGNFFYMGNPNLTAAPSNMQADLLMSNNHYESLESLNYNLRKTLIRVDGQKVSNGVLPVDHPDPAGILTSRAFLAAHAVAGTNRRIIEFAFREFLCIPIAGWADSTGPDNTIGQDVDRYPGGDHTKFLTNCRSCHSNMDGLRGAFAKIHFNNNFVKHANVVTANSATEDGETATTMCQRPSGIACKMNRNDDVFGGGHEVVDTSWVNNANRNSNATYFGWGQPTQGNSIRTLGQMIAGSKAFQNCMAKRAFRAVCKREPTAADQSLINNVGQQFVNDGYNLKNLFSRIVITSECSGANVAP
jgi:hypothetical protein